jgi:hypothetical protein
MGWAWVECPKVGKAEVDIQHSNGKTSLLLFLASPALPPGQAGGRRKGADVVWGDGTPRVRSGSLLTLRPCRQLRIFEKVGGGGDGYLQEPVSAACS